MFGHFNRRRTKKRSDSERSWCLLFFVFLLLKYGRDCILRLRPNDEQNDEVIAVLASLRLREGERKEDAMKDRCRKLNPKNSQKFV
jgi:hypothetical protein